MKSPRPLVVTVFYYYCLCLFLVNLLFLIAVMFSEISPYAIVAQKFTAKHLAATGILIISIVLAALPFILPLKRSTWIYHIIFFSVPLHLTGNAVPDSHFEFDCQIVLAVLFGLFKILVLYLYLQPKVIEYFEHGAKPIDPRTTQNPI